MNILESEKKNWWERLVCRMFHSKSHRVIAIYGKENCRFFCDKCGYDFVGGCNW